MQGRQLVYDALIDPQFPDDNFGRVPLDNRLKRRDKCSALLVRFRLEKFDLPPNAEILKATVSFFVWDPSPAGTMKVCPFEMRTAWDEYEATWQRPARRARWKGGRSFVFGVDTGPPGPGVIVRPNPHTDTVYPPIEYRLDVTDMVRGWLSGNKPNYGLAIAPLIDQTVDRGQFSRIQIVASESRQPHFVPKLTVLLKK